MFSERGGNLFEADDLDALAHGVNCKGVMGAGIAAEFKKRWFAVFTKYRRLCEIGELFPGDCMPVVIGDHGPIVYNLATQNRPGPDAKLRYIARSVG